MSQLGRYFDPPVDSWEEAAERYEESDEYFQDALADYIDHGVDDDDDLSLAIRCGLTERYRRNKSGAYETAIEDLMTGDRRL